MLGVPRHQTAGVQQTTSELERQEVSKQPKKINVPDAPPSSRLMLVGRLSVGSMGGPPLAVDSLDMVDGDLASDAPSDVVLVKTDKSESAENLDRNWLSWLKRSG